MLEKKEALPQRKIKCLFEERPKTEGRKKVFDVLADVSWNLQREMEVIVEVIEKYQKAVYPFLSKIKGLLAQLFEEGWGLGVTRPIGSFPENLFLPWSDLNLMVDCNWIFKKKGISNQNKSEI